MKGKLHVNGHCCCWCLEGLTLHYLWLLKYKYPQTDKWSQSLEPRTDDISLSLRHDNENDLNYLIKIRIKCPDGGQGETFGEHRLTYWGHHQNRVDHLASLGSLIIYNWSCYNSWWCLTLTGNVTRQRSKLRMGKKFISSEKSLKL